MCIIVHVSGNILVVDTSSPLLHGFTRRHGSGPGYITANGEHKRIFDEALKIVSYQIGTAVSKEVREGSSRFQKLEHLWFNIGTILNPNLTLLEDVPYLDGRRSRNGNRPKCQQRLLKLDSLEINGNFQRKVMMILSLFKFCWMLIVVPQRP